MFRDGGFVASKVSPIDDDQIQPNGVDLTLGGVFEQETPGYIGKDGKSVGDRSDVPLTDPEAGRYHLDRGGYIVQYGEQLRVPEEHIGFIYPRSSLLRNSCMLNTAVWDAGYAGRGEGFLQVFHPIVIEDGARIGQFVLAEADHQGTYDGDYQGEHLA